MATLPPRMSTAPNPARVFVVGPDGIVRIGAANDATARSRWRRDVALDTSTPEGLAAFIGRHGVKEAGRLMHDAMFGPGAARDADASTPLGAVAKEWS